MNTLGITEELNKVSIWQNDPENPGKNKLVEVPVFREVEKGIDILVYTLGRSIIRYEKEGSRWKKDYCLTRLKDPIVAKDGGQIKYLIPKGAGTYPFFPPSLLEKFDAKSQIDTLYLTEGYFKAFKGSMAGIDIVGLSSITHMKDKEKGTLHPEILQLMNTCNVERMVWLTDGDCLDLTSKDLVDGIDLYKKPNGFYKTCETFKSLLDDFNVDKWFMHIDIDALITPPSSKGSGTEITRDQVKGLDDLLIAMQDQQAEIVRDLQSVSKPGYYFKKFNITSSLYAVRQYFHLHSVKDFYLFHVNRRKDLAMVEFVWAGTRYKWNETTEECEVKIPGESKLYFRVGDQYYKFIERINQHNEVERGFQPRQKSTIVDDHGKTIIKHISKFEAFCNVPDHVTFNQTLFNCFNVYSPFEHVPDETECTEEDCPTIIAFMKHIFGDRLITIKNPRGGDETKTAYYQLGMDYVQLLYRNPTIRLPILCLVSKENETGKSTFSDLMKAIFSGNVAVVGNADLADDFNSFWATKLLIICDETKIDKQTVVERVKSLTFAKKIAMNSKGKDKTEIDFFGKFMFITNHEENFIYASEEDLRYWVIKVPKIKEKNPDFLENMIAEIPAFLSLLNTRKMVTQRTTRMWFDPELLKTDALRRVIENSRPQIERELREKVKEMFLDFGMNEIYMTKKDIKEEFFPGNKYENTYIEKILKDHLNMVPVMQWVYKARKFNTEEDAIRSVIEDPSSGVETAFEALSHIKREGKVMRYDFPKWETKWKDNRMERVAVIQSGNGRAYVFKRADFVNADEEVDVPSDLKHINQFTSNPEPVSEPAKALVGVQDDLPF